MSPLSEEEKHKIIEEERIRAEERAKYSQPQQVVLKKEKKGISTGAGCLIIIIVFALGSYVMTRLDEKPAPQLIATTRPSITTAAFDVPSLVGKNLTEVRKTLGTPTVDDSEPNAKQQDFTTWDKTWEKDNYHLTVTYNPQTLRITDFFVGLGGDTTGDTAGLLKAGNLSASDQRYKVEFVDCRNCDVPNQYTGVKVTPK